jgi:hypothetical protein
MLLDASAPQMSRMYVDGIMANPAYPGEQF